MELYGGQRGSVLASAAIIAIKRHAESDRVGTSISRQREA